jgi:hypothetical protein
MIALCSGGATCHCHLDVGVLCCVPSLFFDIGYHKGRFIESNNALVSINPDRAEWKVHGTPIFDLEELLSPNTLRSESSSALLQS